jgi:DHA1 family bicyclomycin/chloramphenicol resistance-like MFS transporter
MLNSQNNAFSEAGEPTFNVGTVILTLGLVSAMGSMAIHMLTPALPLLQRDLGTNITGAQLVIGTYLVGLGIGQLLAGPLVDRLGRRRLLFAGLLLFTTASTASAIAPDLESLLAARALQAIGGAAGLVTSRVLIADLFSREDGAAMQASLMMVVLVSPAISPVIGGLLASMGGWRLVPALLALVCLFTLMVSWKFLPRIELAPPTASTIRGSLRSDIARLARNRTFVLATIALSTASSALYMFLSSGAFLLEEQYGLDEKAAGIGFLLVAVASIAGTRMVRWIGRRWNTLLAGCSFILFGSLAGLMLALLGITGPAALIGPMLFLGLGAGVAGPSAINIAVTAEVGLAGTGASMAGASQMLFSGAATVPLGWFAPITSLKLTLALSLASGISFCAAFLCRRAAAISTSEREGGHELVNERPE